MNLHLTLSFIEFVLLLPFLVHRTVVFLGIFTAIQFYLTEVFSQAIIQKVYLIGLLLQSESLNI